MIIIETKNEFFRKTNDITNSSNYLDTSENEENEKNEKSNDFIKNQFDHKILDEIFNTFKITTDFINLINPSDDYIVKIPSGLIEKMRKNEVQFLKDKTTGDLLPTLYDYSNNKFAGQVRLELRSDVSNQALENFSHSIQNYLMKAQYDNLKLQIQEVQQTVNRIERGQKLDRFAEIVSGKKTLINAINASNDINRFEFIHSSIQTLEIGTEKVKNSLISTLDDFPIIPENKFSHLIFIISKENNRSKLNEIYDEIQEDFSFYLEGINSLALAYTLIGEQQLIEKLLSDFSFVLDNSNINRLNLSEPLLYNNTIDFTKVWYRNSEELESRLADSYNIENAYSDIELSVTGNEIINSESSVNNAQE